MPCTPVPPRPQVCLLPGCLEPRLIYDSLCKCEEDDCEEPHLQPECCKRHSGNSAGAGAWLRNDGIIDRQAVDMVIHDDRKDEEPVRLTWVEGMIVCATLVAIGYSLNEATRRLGFDVKTWTHGVFRGRMAEADLARAIAAIKGDELPPAAERRKRTRDAFGRWIKR